MAFQNTRVNQVLAKPQRILGLSIKEITSLASSGATWMKILWSYHSCVLFCFFIHWVQKAKVSLIIETEIKGHSSRSFKKLLFEKITAEVQGKKISAALLRWVLFFIGWFLSFVKAKWRLIKCSTWIKMLLRRVTAQFSASLVYYNVWAEKCGSWNA